MKGTARQPTGSTVRTKCCIVGAGPAGMFLAWNLARCGIDVLLLERHRDFDRDFRGDTLHPGALELLEQMGLVAQVLALPHSRMQSLVFRTPSESLTVADLSRLRTRYPFVAMLPQSRLLQLLADDAQRFPAFSLETGAEVRELVQRDGKVAGVRYRTAEGSWREVAADLTVAADGRQSRLRHLAKMEAVAVSQAIDILWFRLPMLPGQEGGGYLNAGGYMIVLQRDPDWQVGFVIPKHAHRTYRQAGIESLRSAVARLAPGLAPSVRHLVDWQQVKLLSIQADRLRQWHRPGLLFLGDAAHVMSPVGGVGINYAIQDAIEAANLLVDPLRNGRLTASDLRRVARRRQGPTRIVQAIQDFDQRHLIQRALDSRGEFRLPAWIKWASRTPLLRAVPPRVFAFGVRRVKLRV